MINDFKFRFEHNHLNRDEGELFQKCYLKRKGYSIEEIDELDYDEAAKVIAMIDKLDERDSKRTANELAKIIAKMFGGS